MTLILRRAVLAAVLLAVAALHPGSTRAQVGGGASVSITALGTPHTEDFGALASAGTADVLPAGWQFNETGTNANGTYAAGDGSSNTGNTYSFGATASAERALGGLQSGSLVPVFGAAFTNNTGATINRLDISYAGEQWRLGAVGRADRIDFQIGLAAPSLITGTYTDVDALDFSSRVTSGSVGALDGNAEANRAVLSATITGVSIPDGQTFFIRWTDFNASGADDGLAVDDFSITASQVLTPTDPTAVGSANPSSLTPGSSTLLTVAVTRGQNPTSTGLEVTADLTPIGGAAVQTFFDDGTNGDATAGDDVFSFRADVPGGTTAGLKTLPVTVTDAEGRTAPPTSISLTVREPQFVVISQVYGGGGNTGATLRNDFVELFNRGTTPVDVTGWSVQYASAAGTSWQVTSLTGVIPAGGYYLVQEAAGAGGTTDLPTPDATGVIAMAAGAGKVALVEDATALSGTCPLPGVVDHVGYGTANCFEGTGAAPGLSSTTAALRVRGGCRDTDDNAADFTAGSPNPRNRAAARRDCSIAPLVLTIAQIQGPGAASPFAGQEATTTGIVTARKVNGFFLQDPTGDGDPATSEGLFVFTSSTPAVAVGDEVRATGLVSEFFGLTQVSSFPGDFAVLSSGQAVPAAIEITPAMLDPNGPADQLERFEGMQLRAASLTTVSPSNGFGEVFTVLSGVPRPRREPGLEPGRPAPPGAPCCLPRFDGNPEKLVVDTDGLLGTTAVVLTSGVTLGTAGAPISGPLDFTFGDYKLDRQAGGPTSANLSAVPVPPPAEDQFTAGSTNLREFFSSRADFPARLEKASRAIRHVMRSPDIVGVQEVGDLATLALLAARLNADTVAEGGTDPRYEPFLEEGTDEFPGDDIDVGFLVKTSRVQVVSVTQHGKGDTFTDPTEGDQDALFERPPLVLRATVASPHGSRFPVTVVVHHLQSLIDIDQDPGRGPRQRLKRRLQAEFTARLAQGLQGENLVLVGDFNAFQFNDGYVDPMGTIRGVPTPPDQVVESSPDLVDPDLVALIDTGLIDAEQRYSFVFGGNAQALDHVLVDGEMLALAAGYAYARNNADFPASLAADSTRPERVSDHDMPVAYFRFPPPLADLAVSKAASTPTVQTGGSLTYTISVRNDGPDRAMRPVVSDVLPPGTTFEALAAPAGWACTTPAVGSTGTVSCTAPSLEPAAAPTFHLAVGVSCATAEGPLQNRATAGSDTTDPDLADNSAIAVIAVTNPAPEITGASVDRPVLWPPLYLLRRVTVSYAAGDNCGAVTTSLRVTSDEPVVGFGPGFSLGLDLAGLTFPDWVVEDEHHVWLRAERYRRGDGRVYTITITATDAAGKSSEQAVTVAVPRTAP